MPNSTAPSTVIPSFRYRDAHAAIEWFCSVLGFTKNAVYEGPDNTIAHAQLTREGGMIMLGSARDDEHGRNFSHPDELSGATTGAGYIVVPDDELDSLYAHAQTAEAFTTSKILRSLNSTDYGSREFAVTDPEGHVWTVGTYNPWH